MLHEASHGLGRGSRGFILAPLVHEFIESRAVDALLRWRGQVAVDRDLRAEIARFNQNHMNAERTRLQPQAFADAFQGEFARAVEAAERQPDDASQRTDV